jgi:hypothetical protein
LLVTKSQATGPERAGFPNGTELQAGEQTISGDVAAAVKAAAHHFFGRTGRGGGDRAR